MNIIRYISFCFLLSFLIFKGNAQDYFNYRYNISGEELYDFATTILPNSDGYLIGAESGSPDNPDRRRIALVTVDFLGQMTGVSFYGQPGIDYGVGYPGFLIKANGIGYALTGFKRSPYPGLVRTQGILMRLDENYDTLWMRLYGDIVEPCDTELILRQIRQLPDGGFSLFGGPMAYYDQRPHFSLIRTDSAGNKLWEKYYGEPPHMFFAFSFNATTDKGYILSGIRYTYPVDQSYDPVVFKTDSLGNEEWSKNFGSDYLDYTISVDTTIDGKILIGTIIADSSLSHDNYYGRICFIKLDNGGNIIWQRKYGKSDVNNQLWSIKSLPNGKIVATGSSYRFYPGSGPRPRMSWIICTDSAGDSLWYREYSLLNGEYSTNFLYDVVQTNDSGFVACGYVHPVYPDTGTQDTWIIKVDSIGCESPEYCWTGIKEPEIKPVEIGKLIAYPNPANNHITFEIGGEEWNSGSQIDIYNIFGSEMAHEILWVNTRCWTLDVSALPPGIYVARILSPEGEVRSVKFVVN